MFKRKKRNIPTLNTSSTADISFMLLIFFLVTTSMNQSKGLERILPPENKEKTTVTDVNKKNILILELKADRSILADDKPIKINELRKHVITFIEQKAEREKHIISVNAERNAKYNDYFNMQNEIVAAYRILRNKRAIAVYKHPLEECTPEEKMELKAYYPQRIADVYDNNEEGGEE